MLTENAAKSREYNADDESTQSPRVQRWIIVDAENASSNVKFIAKAETPFGGFDIDHCR